MNTYTDTQLKQALAQMLPEKVKWTVSPPQYPDWCCLVWLNTTPTREVLDTELLHLCWLAEETLPQGSLCAMSNELDIMHELEGKPCDASQWKHHKSWQQRTIALAKVKGVEIV